MAKSLKILRVANPKFEREISDAWDNAPDIIETFGGTIVNADREFTVLFDGDSEPFEILDQERCNLVEIVVNGAVKYRLQKAVATVDDGSIVFFYSRECPLVMGPN